MEKQFLSLPICDSLNQDIKGKFHSFPDRMSTYTTNIVSAISEASNGNHNGNYVRISHVSYNSPEATQPWMGCA